jgi:hypothetical protein
VGRQGGVPFLHDAFSLIAREAEIHTTPSAAKQEFVYCLFRKKEDK